LIFIFGLLESNTDKSGDKKIDQPGFPKANFVPIQYVVAVELVLLAESLGFSAATSSVIINQAACVTLEPPALSSFISFENGNVGGISEGCSIPYTKPEG
jgi:hypothetical protein